MTAPRDTGVVGIRHRVRVEWIDTDAAGIYHNTAVVRFVEAAEAALMRERGLDGYFSSAPRVRYELDFESPLRFGQEATAVVEVVRIGTTSMTFAFELWGEPFDGRPRTRAAHGRFVTVHIDPHTGRSAPWPQPWLTALGVS
ncbi:acyl-CoA thioesterase [Streptosporangium sp. NBC_01639]|uniref:acyl-CoA thioesterase n=1 Tax=Streptosporangium sp. NBC_01639 TaxID=2975948 RepID=UPI003869A27A|nr:acyl-CoA thioesterase [Streptosporangium sp. NBC_01639]